MIVLRVFYQENAMLCDGGIGILDFIPRHLSGGGLFKRPKYEPFDEVLTRAYIWLSEHNYARLINLKTLDVKLKSCELRVFLCACNGFGKDIKTFRYKQPEPI